MIVSFYNFIYNLKSFCQGHGECARVFMFDHFYADLHWLPINLMGLYRPLDGITNLKYKLV